MIRQAGQRESVYEKNKRTKNYDHELSILSKKQKDLRIKIQDTKSTDQKSTLKTERNKIIQNIRERQISPNSEEIDRKIEGTDASKKDHAIFRQQGSSTKRHLKTLRRKIQSEN